jgi:hypothetical protein
MMKFFLLHSPLPIAAFGLKVFRLAVSGQILLLSALPTIASASSVVISEDVKWVEAECTNGEVAKYLTRSTDLVQWEALRLLEPGERWVVPTLANNLPALFFRLQPADDVVARFDFGHGDVESGYEQVTTSTAYSSGTGYGWASTTGLDWRNRTGPSSLLRDFVFTTDSAEFRVDVPNGAYQVTVRVGDFIAAQVPMNIVIEGTSAASGLTTATAGSFIDVISEVEVVDGQINVQIAGVASGDTARINALEVAVADPAVQPPAAAFDTIRFPISAEIPSVPDAGWGTNRVYQHTWFFPRLADVEGDGNVDLVYFKGTAEQVAYKTDGTQLWRYRDTATPNSLVRADCNVPIFDFDRDGTPEIACVRAFGGQPYLVLVKLSDGTLLKKAPAVLDVSSGFDYHLTIRPVQLDGPTQDWSILVHKDYEYIAAYDLNLNQRWRINIPELGHTTACADVDGDGKDELFTGTRLYDHDGTVIWNKPELLNGTGETHPDSNPIVDVDGDGTVELFCGPGGRLLDLAGNTIWQFKPEGMTEVQSVRVLNLKDGGQILALTDLPQTGTLTWRGMTMRDVRSVTYLVDRDGQELKRLNGMHVPYVGDWDGDGYDELIYLSRDGHKLEAFNPNGALVGRVPLSEPRVYISDIVTLPLLGGAIGDQLVIHEWSSDWSQAHTVIYKNLQGYHDRKPFNQLDAAVFTGY